MGPLRDLAALHLPPRRNQVSKQRLISSGKYEEDEVPWVRDTDTVLVQVLIVHRRVWGLDRQP